ncbi:flavin reductase family protein [Desulfuromonas sp. AOP6]|uniref:flavin reductase family protein n=1 Tax=Desulfuromonas sp. AOP6 TaxID=1566351 RepID=UPI001272E7D3|nr:flavin reductase family protein [Desulfuromonas sp. AOP6]BCA79679.1 flavin reductase [Desulfuromonas sp. AOP6]
MLKRKLGPCVTFFPQPTTLVSSVDKQGSSNLMTASWVGIVSKTPPTIGVSLNRSRKTYNNIMETQSFVVNMVPASLAVEADYCGLKSGRDEDKEAVAGLTLEPATLVEAPLLVESPLNVECRLTSEVPLGEYSLLLGEIVEIHAREDAFLDEGMDALAFDPLVYLGGIREYWSLGEKKAQAYRDGKKFFKS